MNIRDDFVLKEINEGYLVGGSIRDLFTKNCVFCDRDISIKGAENFARKIANKWDGTFIELDNENKIYRVVLPDKINFLDISELQGNSIEEDLKRRDFTINAIAYDLTNDKFVDVTGGLKDLKNKVLRHIDDKNFEDDPLRILRAFRFYAVTGFKMTIELENALKKYLPLALNPAKERINYEIMKLFGGDFASSALLKMDEFGLLEKIFPCVTEMKKVPPNTHHHLDLFHHVVETVRQIEILYNEISGFEKEHLDAIDFGGFPRINHLKLAGFLHDIGKFSTWTIEESGRHRFIKHDDVGSKMVVPLLRDLKFSKKQIEYISCMIKNHIYPSNVIVAPNLNDKVMMRYVRKMDDNVVDNIILAKADRLSARGVDITEEIVNTNISGLDKLLDFYLSKKDSLAPLPKLIDGREIMEILNIKPSPNLGEIINAINEAQLNGDITTHEEAVNYIKNLHL
ncbi:CCA tRNA nucleotidyltransferase [bacterium]|nr:CCA tRNA nucleotidyltransferase [bacterium]